MYVAYGADISSRWMSLNCPAARVAGSCNLVGWRLEFRQSGADGLATLERKKGARVPCVVWEVPDDYEEYFDRINGFPTHYRKETIELPSGKAAVLYLLNGREAKPPRTSLSDAIRSGYLDFGINMRYLDEAIRRASKAVMGR